MLPTRQSGSCELKPVDGMEERATAKLPVPSGLPAHSTSATLDLLATVGLHDSQRFRSGSVQKRNSWSPTVVSNGCSE